MNQEIETIDEEAKRRAAQGDACVAGLLALINQLRDELEQKSRVISEWESGGRTRRESVWGYDG